jgi:type II secretory pathway component PulF
MGWDADVMARALRDVAAVRAAWKPFRHVVKTRILYLGWVLFGLQAIAAYVLYRIVPQFQGIFASYGVALPEMTQVVSSAGGWLIETWLLPALLLLQLALLLALPLTFLDWFSWDVPAVDRLWRRRHAAAALRALSYGMEGGQPLPALLGALARHYPSRWARRRLRRVHHDVAFGADWLASLRAWGLLRRTEAAVLEAAQRVGNLPWACGSWPKASSGGPSSGCTRGARSCSL